MLNVTRTLLLLTCGGTALALLLLAVRYLFFRKMPSTFYYYAWLIVLLRFLLPLPGLMPAQSTQQAPGVAPVIAGSAPSAPEIREEVPAKASTEAVRETVFPVFTETEPAQTATRDIAPKAGENTSNRFANLLHSGLFSVSYTHLRAHET